jgi:hypothetical protein
MRRLIHRSLASVCVFTLAVGVIGEAFAVEIPLMREPDKTSPHAPLGALQQGPALFQSWDSPKVRAIVAAANRLPLPPDTNSKSAWGWRQEELVKLLKKELTGQELREIGTFSAGIPIGEKDRDGYAHGLACALLSVFLYAKDRDCLVSLLSNICPRPSLYYEIEFYLAFYGEQEKLEDPILILGDAYAKSTAPQVRKELAEAVRRGFAGLGVRGADDDEYVENAMRWYRWNRWQYVVDMRYGSNDVVSPKGPLFVKRRPEMPVP